MVMMLVISKGGALEWLKMIFFLTIYNVMLCCILKICLIFPLLLFVWLFMFSEKGTIATHDRVLINSLLMEY